MRPTGPVAEALNRKGVLAVLFGVFFLSGCDLGESQRATTQPPPPEVAVVTVRTQPFDLTATLSGRTSAYRVAEVRPQVNGLIQKRLFDEGSDVQEGEVLYQIDSAPFRAALDNARATLHKAEARMVSIRLRAKRYRDLLADKAVSQQDYDDADAAEKQALAEIEHGKAVLETARIHLEYTRVTAPISGRIGRSSVTDGALVSAYQPTALATIQQLDPIYADVTQSSAKFLRLRRSLEAGQLSQDGKNSRKVRLLLEDGTLYPLEGMLQFADITVDPTTGSFILRVVVPNPAHLLLPGMFVRAVVQEGIAREAILIPQQGVSRTPRGEPIAWIVDAQDIVQQRFLSLDRAVGDQWLVTSGLAPGDRVIVEGTLRAQPGERVRAVPFEEPGPRDESPEGTTARSHPETVGGP